MKKIFYSVMALAALAACNKEQVSTAPEFDENEIRLTSFNTDISTKAPIDGESFDGSTMVMVLASNVENNFKKANLYGDLTNMYMKFNAPSGGSQEAVGFCEANGDPSAKYYNGTNTTYLVGLFPHDKWGDVGADSYSLTIDGQTDAMISKPIGVTKETNSANPGKLEFSHLLTKLLVTAELNDDTDPGYWSTIKKIELIKVGSGESISNQLTINASDMSKTPSSEGSTTTTSINFAEYNGSSYGTTTELNKTIGTGASNHDPAPVAYILCPPTDATSDSNTNEYVIKITVGVEGGQDQVKEVGVNLKSNGDTNDYNGSTKGYAFTINLSFSATEILATATITDWIKGGTVTIPITPEN